MHLCNFRGSVLNHVILLRTIIREEAKLQMEKIDEYPDIVMVTKSNKGF
ncbi:hypothetical protein [Caldicellulosiruptor acetigenus]|nr:hypothetical protein [Caldicellulosiruptor acetigenus]